MKLFTLLCCSILASASGASSLFFGKFKWGQDEESVFITIYCPKMDASVAKVAINDTHFTVTGPSPKSGEDGIDISFEFREDVVSSNYTMQPWYWKAGNAHDSLFFTIPKRHSHFFDRLVFSDVTRAFKRKMEIDWNRYKRVDGEENEDDIEEDEEEAWEDDYDKEQKGNLLEITNENFMSVKNKNTYMVVLATYPWCKHCKAEVFMEIFSKTARAKALKKKVRFAKVDLRQQRKVGRELDLGCLEDCAKNIIIFRDGVQEGAYDGTFSQDKEQIDEERDKMVNFLERDCHPSPWPVTSVKELEAIKKEGDKVMPIGIFGPEHEREKAVFIAYARENRAVRHHGLVTDKAEEITKHLLGDYLDKMPAPPIVVMYKNFGNKDDDYPLYFGGANDTFNRGEIESFVSDLQFQPLVWMNSSESDNDKAGLGKRGLPAVHLWLDSAKKHPQVMKAVRRAAVEMQREVAFVYHDYGKEGTKQLHTGITEAARSSLLNYGLDGTSKSPVLGLDGRSITKAFPAANSGLAFKQFAYEGMDGDTTTDDIKDWVRAVLKGDVAAASRSQPIAEEPGSNDQVVTMVGKTFEKYVMQNANDVFLNMYVSTQPHYKIVAPELEKLASALHQAGAHFQVFNYTWDENQIPQAAEGLEMIKRFTPVGTSLLFFLPAGKGGHGVQRHIAADQGTHDAVNMIDFLFQHASKPFDLTKAKSVLKEMSLSHPHPYAANCGVGTELCKTGFSCEHNVCHWTGTPAELDKHNQEAVEKEKEAGKQDL